MIKRLQKIIFGTQVSLNFCSFLHLRYEVFSTNARLYINCIMMRTRTKWQTHLEKFGRYKNFMKVVSIRCYNAKVLFTKNIYIQIIGDVIDYRMQNMPINWYLHYADYHWNDLKVFLLFTIKSDQRWNCCFCKFYVEISLPNIKVQIFRSRKNYIHICSGFLLNL
jgi:hypothetical protein